MILSYKQASTYLKNHTTPNDIIATNVPLFINYYADRNGVYISNNAKGLLEQTDTLDIHYILVSLYWSQTPTVSNEVITFLNTDSRFQKAFEVYDSGTIVVLIYRIN